LIPEFNRRDHREGGEKLGRKDLFLKDILKLSIFIIKRTGDQGHVCGNHEAHLRGLDDGWEMNP
jgi:hypothetical protein